MNPVIGDLALDEATRLGGQEGALSTEKDRVRCHLRFALSRLLSETDADHHPPQRTLLLNELSSYADAGRFPVHSRREMRELNATITTRSRSRSAIPGDDRKDEHRAHVVRRAPRFLDSNGTPCAVAHLLQRSDNRAKGGEEGEGSRLAAAVASNTSLNRAWINEIAADPEVGSGLKEWCKRSGLSKADLALIQPSYPCVAIDPDPKCRTISALSMHHAVAVSFVHLVITAWKGSTVWTRALWASIVYVSISILLGDQLDIDFEKWEVTSQLGSVLWGAIVLTSFFMYAAEAEIIALKASWRTALLSFVSIPISYTVYCGLVSICRESIEFVGDPEIAVRNSMGCRWKNECPSFFPAKHNDYV